jgi:hypothetical protein
VTCLLLVDSFNSSSVSALAIHHSLHRLGFLPDLDHQLACSLDFILEVHHGREKPLISTGLGKPVMFVGL